MTRVQIPALLLTRCVTSGKLLNLSVSHFLIFEMGHSYLIQVSQGLSELAELRSLAHSESVAMVTLLIVTVAIASSI